MVAYFEYLATTVWPLNLAASLSVPGERLARGTSGRRNAGGSGTHSSCPVAATTAALPVGGLAVVCRDAGANHRAGASRQPGLCRPLHLFSFNRSVLVLVWFGAEMIPATRMRVAIVATTGSAAHPRRPYLATNRLLDE